jgi:hypothetical protein
MSGHIKTADHPVRRLQASEPTDGPIVSGGTLVFGKFLPPGGDSGCRTSSFEFGCADSKLLTLALRVDRC